MFLIFDVDGTMFRNVEFHFKSWELLFSRHCIPFNETVRVSLLGRTAREAILDHFGDKLNDRQVAALVDEKEKAYRDLYHLHVKPVDGLVDLLDKCSQTNIPCAVASSGTRGNIEFVLKQALLDRKNSITPVCPFFSKMVSIRCSAKFS